MDWANASVSKEEYEQNVHDAVNSYYEHCMSTMSHEDAIAATYEYSEGLLSEYEAAFPSENETENDNSSSMDDGIE